MTTSFSLRAALPAAAALIVLSACGRKPVEPPPPSADQLARLMQGNTGAPKPPPPRLTRLPPGTAPPGRDSGRSCRLASGRDILLLARGGMARARTDGRVQDIPQAGPVDATGAFFRAPGVTISIGARDPRLGPGPAHVTILGRGEDPPQRLEADWSCAG